MSELPKEYLLSHNYPNHPIFYFTKALLLGYNLVYKFKLQESNLDTFLGLIKEAISQEPLKYNKVKYLMLQATILQGISQFEKAIEAIEEAITIIPHLYQLYSVKAYLLVTGGNHLKALQEINRFTEKYPQTKRYSNLTKSFILAERMKKYDEALVVIDESIKIFPNESKFVNNKALFLAELNRKEEALETADLLISLNLRMATLMTPMEKF